MLPAWIEKKTLSTLLVMTFVLIGTCAVCRVTQVQAAGQDRSVVLDPGSVTTEVCVLVVHRSRMHNRIPVARCATPAELKELVR